MASAQLLYNNNTTKTTATATTKVIRKPNHQSIENHIQASQLSIFAETEVEGTTGYISKHTNNNNNNNSCDRNRKQHSNKDNKEPHSEQLWCWWFENTLELEARGSATVTSKQEEQALPNYLLQPATTTTTTATIDKTTFVFITPENDTKRPTRCQDTIWETGRKTSPRFEQKLQQLSKQQQRSMVPDDVAAGAAGPEQFDTEIEKFRLGCASLRSVANYSNSKNRTIQQQQQTHLLLQPQRNNYNSTANIYSEPSLFDNDYKGIEEYKIHTTETTTTTATTNDNSNSNTKMPLLSNLAFHQSESSFQTNFPQHQQKQPCSRNAELITDINNTNQQQQQQSCQKSKYVVQQCCHHDSNNKFYTCGQQHEYLVNDNVAGAATAAVSNSSLHFYDKTKKQQQQQQQQEEQQRKFFRISSFKSVDGKGFTTSGHSTWPATSNVFSPTSSVVRVAMDLQRMAKCLLSLLVLFNMLPLFYAECDQTFVSRIGGPQNGTFTAPLLHNQQNHSRQCLYTFLAGPGQRVEVVFKSFNLRGNPPDGSAVGELPSCVHEYMDIYSEVQSSEPAELINSPFGGRYCGTIPPRQRISMYRAIAISFFTNKNLTTPDLFEGTFRFINASEYEIGIPIAGSPCSYTITPSLSINKTGVLISPTYPGAYPKDMSCTYQFLGESNQRVRLEFRDFDLFFGGPHCPFDYVKVYDGPDNSSALIGTYCGQQRNLVLYSSESSLFVHFFTLSRTANTQNRGFKGIYEFSESFVKLDFIRENDGIHIRGSECDQKILSKKESTGFVLSPNYPYPYIPKTVCRYFIYGMQDAQHLERVRLEFLAFNIPKVEHKDKSESNCTDGYLKVYLKGQETADAYDKFDYELCGNETQRVVSDGPRLAMVFSSGELQGRGFKGKYTFETEYKIPGTAAPDGTCSFTYVSSSKKRGELNSPRYPSNYPSDTNCSYLFLAEANEQVTIVFDHFKIKADGNANVTAGAYGSVNCFEDWLEMYVVYRDNNDRFLGRYCGMTAPGPVESPRGAVGLRITLHTDQENVASGFKARYFFETAKSEIGDCGGNFSSEDSGIITSPNYPAGYKAPGRGMASMACNWLMTAKQGYKLSIHFEHFSLEGDPANRGCPAAVLRLWVNVDSDQPPLELCGEKPPMEQWHYISTGQTARISFTTSDKTVGAPGFRIVWTEIQDSGPGPPAIGFLCESTYHFQCEVGYCISDKLRCDGVKNCGPNDNSDEMHCTTKAQAEDHGVLIITTLLVVSFLICLLCILYHSRRKRRQQLHQLGLHRNAHYDSQTSATVFRRF
ncbi:cubilin isoform X2 [Musca domestica]|uniref:Cubilin isoform X2 n=1 Tax=Musca domestica TaxID=7370 RepID=A0ABM3V0P4_MUSDO|nr:cubilin isoform X2 [Musca domestica]